MNDPLLVDAFGDIVLSDDYFVEEARRSVCARRQFPSWLLHLPTELHLQIISHLSPLGIFCLRSTNRHFHNITPRPTHDMLLQIEKTRLARQRGWYACRRCIRLRHESCFAESQLKKYSLDSSYRHKRFCADCGFGGGDGYHNPGTRVVVNGVTWVWCARCKEVKEDEVVQNGNKHLCIICPVEIASP